MKPAALRFLLAASAISILFPVLARPLDTQAEVSDLPITFDWRASGKLPPVRNASSGSCNLARAFAATAMLESAAAIESGLRLDLAERELLACAPDACAAQDWGVLDTIVQRGVRAEAAYPLKIPAGVCPAVKGPAYRAMRWETINPQGATTEEIKHAVLEHGPVGVSMCAGPDFQRYRQGVFKADESLVCQGKGNNHAVVITGWDDTQEAWIVRNHWGAQWGLGGSMYIKYGLPSLGDDAVYLVYAAAPLKAPRLLGPQAGAAVPALEVISLAWQPPAGSRADGYQTQLAADARFATLLREETTTAPVLMLHGLPGNQAFFWRVRAVRTQDGASLPGPWSAPRSLNTLPEAPAWLQTQGGLPRPRFDWFSPSRVLSFELQIEPAATSAGARSYRGSGDRFLLPVPLLTEQAYLWRVRVRGKFGYSPWSSWSALR